MKLPDLNKINQKRKLGYRPQAAGCFVLDKKVFMFYGAKYKLWQFPQGGIDNGESVRDAFWREMSEELGDNFVDCADKEIELIGEDSVIFPPHAQNSRKLALDDGTDVSMMGKWYFYFVAKQTKKPSFLQNSEFDDYKLLSYGEALKLAESIYQQGKQRTTIKILNKLHQLDYIK